MKVIGRKKEINTLERCLASSQSELIAMYGRRRVGKTFLVREIFKEHMILEVTGLYSGTMKDQLKNFHEQLILRNKRLAKKKTPKDWFDAFVILQNYLDGLKSKKKKVIFIDEFPWIATTRSKFLTMFEHFWNAYCTKRTDLIVVICGSAASYMVKNIIRNRGGLYNRLSHRIQLEPFNLNETELFLKNKNIHLEKYDLLQLYMAIGGIPHYLEKIQKGQSVVQNIDCLCFEKGGDLANEFNEVFASLFSDSGGHMEMIKVLAQSKRGTTRSMLLNRCKMQQTGFTSNVLWELMESGFVTQYTPFGKRNRNSLFRISDEYCAFYLKFIESHKNQGEGTWEKLFTKQTNKIWSGFAFETICLKHVQQIKKALGIAKVYTLDSGWFNENAQVDLVIDRDDHRINLVEIKFHKGPFTIDKTYHENLRKKVSEFTTDTKTRKGVFVTMLTTFGIPINQYSLNIVESDITMNCLFEAD